MDIVEELPFAPKTGVVDVFKDVYHEQVVVRSFVDVICEAVLNTFILPAYDMPTVRASQRLASFMDAVRWMNGFKDGIVGMTEDDSKLQLCNNNITNAPNVFYYNWVPFINEASTKFSTNYTSGVFIW